MLYFDTETVVLGHRTTPFLGACLPLPRSIYNIQSAHILWSAVCGV